MRFGGLAWRMPVVVASVFGIASCSRDAEESVEPVAFVTSDPGLRAAMLEEEDARGLGPSGTTSLREGLIATESELQQLAVRAVGRLEDPGLIPLTFPLLFSDDEAVRAEAVNAMGQATRGELGDEVADVLLDYLAREPQEGPTVRGMIARTLGRLRYADAGRFRRAQATLIDLTHEGDGDAPIVALIGAAMGLEAMAHGTGRDRMSEAAVARLSELTTLNRTTDDTFVRRVAITALSTIGAVGPEVLGSAVRDSDADVRRLAVRIIGRSTSAEVSPDLLIDALTDSVPRVRAEAVRAYSARAPEVRECPLLLSASRDEDLHVALVALDLLQQTCENRPQQEEFLSGLAFGLENAGRLDWHRGAHALVALATVSPDSAATLVDGALGSANPFVRMYVAQAAIRMGSTHVLEALAADPSPNVRTAAARGLLELVGHDADGVLVAQLEQDDPQLLLTVAELLEGTTSPAAAVGPLIAALARISEMRYETLRDPRMALLERINETGGVEQAEELEPYLSDYDPVVAARVAGILTNWAGGQRSPRPVPLVAPVLPSAQELERLARTRVILEMARGGEIEIRLLVGDAPTNAARFERLAASGYFDGLTFHRVVTNFVAQGGSPGANEYAGAPRYTRDEVGIVSHLRGTVGTSTRGRDTGDGQFFINLVDNLYLDHEYTVFGRVVSGMDVVDAVAEGDVIVRATIVVQ